MLLFFFFNDTATTEIYTLSLHDALPISRAGATPAARPAARVGDPGRPPFPSPRERWRSRGPAGPSSAPEDCTPRPTFPLPRPGPGSPHASRQPWSSTWHAGIGPIN